MWRVPGRIALVGEHNDWAGGAAVVVPHRRGIVVSVKPAPHLRAHAVMENQRLSWFPGEAAGALALVPAVLEVLGISQDLGAQIEISGDLPPGRGFSSSAAVAVALVRALSAFTQHDPGPPEHTATLAWRAEHQGLGVNCGLLDPMACAYGCPLYLEFDRTGRLTQVQPFETRLTLVVANFAAPRDTPGILSALGAARETPHVQRAFSGFELAARGLVPQLLRGDLDGAGAAMDHCQALYEQELLRLPALAAPGLLAAVRAAREAGAIGAKFSGAGGDGSVVALVSPDRASNVVNTLASMGLSAEAVTIVPDNAGAPTLPRP